MKTIVLYQNQCVRSTNQNVSKRPSFLSLIYLHKRCVLSILEISHTNQIALVFIYPDATDKLDSGLNISRWYFSKNNFFGFELFYPFFPDQQTMKKNHGALKQGSKSKMKFLNTLQSCNIIVGDILQFMGILKPKLSISQKGRVIRTKINVQKSPIKSFLINLGKKNFYFFNFFVNTLYISNIF